MYSAQNRNNLILNNLYNDNANANPNNSNNSNTNNSNSNSNNYNNANNININKREKSALGINTINNSNNNNNNTIKNSSINNNIINNNKNIKNNNSIFNPDNLLSLISNGNKNHNNVYTPLNNNNNIRNSNLQKNPIANFNNNNVVANSNLNEANANRIFSPQHINRNINSGISINKNKNFSTIANNTQKKVINTTNNNNLNNLSNLSNNQNNQKPTIKQLFQSNYDTINLTSNTPNKINKEINKIQSSIGENSNKSYKENFEQFNHQYNNNQYNDINNNTINDINIRNNLTFLFGPGQEKKLLNINENEGTKNNFNLNAKSVKEYSYREDQNFSYRHTMEDYSRIIDRYMNDSTKGIFCLFDGHGGSEPVKYSRDNLPEILAKFLSDTKLNNIEKALNSSFLKLDEELKTHLDCENSGSTACVIYIHKDQDIITGGRKTFYCANVGDTRCILISSNGFKRMSFDHKCTDETEVARIRKLGGVVFNGRVFGQLALSRALGDHGMKKYGVTASPFINKHIVSEKDKYFVVCSDGVWDVCTDEDIYKMSFKIKNADEYSNMIVNSSLEKGSRDNISCIVVKIN
jgi:serine/threonine protein phosphatase PrpC